VLLELGGAHAVLFGGGGPDDLEGDELRGGEGGAVLEGGADGGGVGGTGDAVEAAGGDHDDGHDHGAGAFLGAGGQGRLLGDDRAAVGVAHELALEAGARLAAGAAEGGLGGGRGDPAEVLVGDVQPRQLGAAQGEDGLVQEARAAGRGAGVAGAGEAGERGLELGAGVPVDAEAEHARVHVLPPRRAPAGAGSLVAPPLHAQRHPDDDAAGGEDAEGEEHARPRAAVAGQIRESARSSGAVAAVAAARAARGARAAPAAASGSARASRTAAAEAAAAEAAAGRLRHGRRREEGDQREGGAGQEGLAHPGYDARRRRQDP
jgi:hypothetical protein